METKYKYRKYIGWGMTVMCGNQKRIVIVPAKSKKAACEIFEELGLAVSFKKQIRHVCIVKYPGPDDVKKLNTASWDEIKLID